MSQVIVNPLERPDWDTLLLSRDECSLFHTSRWARVLSASYGYEPLYFVSTDQGKLTALIPFMEVKSFLTGRRGVSLPFTDYCDSIVPEGERLQDILDNLIDYGQKRKWKYLELRGANDIAWNRPPSYSYYGHIMDLTKGEDKTLSQLRDSTRANIRKAEKRGVRISLNTSAESMAEFYRLNCMTRKRHGLPPQPYRFFENLYDFVISRGHGFIACALFEKRTIAGAIYLHWEGKAMYKYGASDMRHQNLRANNLIMWEAVKWLIRHGDKSLCMGRTEPYNKGLRQFKNGWGAIEREIHYYRFDLKKNKFVEGDTEAAGYAGLMQKLPVPLLKLIGRVAYRHVG